ncbi:MAG: transposase [Candidatus Aenigmarchaeota archaeon]|nr:transposase [Candidatus Aenigmarchaeota archaeon]
MTRPAYSYVEEEIRKALWTLGDRETARYSDILQRMDLGSLGEGYRQIRFSYESMFKLAVLMRLSGIRFQTRMVRHLKENREEAEKLGFGKRVPDQRTISYFINHVMDKETKELAEFAAKKIDDDIKRHALLIEDVVVVTKKNPKPKRRVSRQTFHIRKDAKIRKLCRFIKKEIYPMIWVPTRHNSIYSRNDFLDLLLHMSLTRDFAEDGSKTMREFRKRSPDADTLLYHIKKSGDMGAMQDMFVKAFEHVFKAAKASNFFRNRKCDLAVDYTGWHFYGNRSTPMVMGGKSDRGTNHYYKFATVDVLEAGKRFTLLALPVGDFDNNKDMVRKLLEYARSKVRINRVFLDRGFFSSDVINMLKKMGIHFIMPAMKNSRIKKISDSVKAPKIINDYVMGKGSNSSTFNLLILESDKGNIPVSTNIVGMRISPGISKRVLQLYGRRWGIETGYRVKKENFRPKTTSKNYLVRLFFFNLSVIIYDVWVAINLMLSIFLFGKISRDPLLTAKLMATRLFVMRDVP